MLAKQRQAVVLEEVRRRGGVRVSDLTELLRVSDMTIRRDLDVLARRGLVEKVHGGATAVAGPVAVASIRALNLDLLFMGVHGMDLRAGFSTPNLMEAETDRVMARAARRVVVVADHTKWGTIGLSSIIALDEADVLVTDE